MIELRWSVRGIARGLLISVVVSLHAEELPTNGTLVDIGGHKLFVNCLGPTNSGLTVVFEAGGGGTSKDWARVQEALSARVRTCSYDRAGLGHSEAGPGPRTMRQEAFELHLLLEAQRISGPV